MQNASGMAVRVHVEKAVSAEERTSAWNSQESVEKTWKNAASQGRAGRRRKISS